MVQDCRHLEHPEVSVGRRLITRLGRKIAGDCSFWMQADTIEAMLADVKTGRSNKLRRAGGQMVACRHADSGPEIARA